MPYMFDVERRVCFEVLDELPRFVAGTIIGDDDAMKLWQRSYEPGWEPRV